MSYALGTRGYIPNLKDWDKDLYKDRGPGGEIRYKVNEKDQQYLSERQISEMKSDFLNKGQAEHTDKQYWSDIRFNESVRGTLGNIRDIPKNLVAPFKQPGITGNDRTARPNMDVPAWMRGEGDAPVFSPNYAINPENYSKYFNKKSGHFHSLLHQKQALNQYDVQRDAAAAQAKIDQGVVDRDKLLEANRIENEAVIAELNTPVSNPQKPDTSGDASVDSTEKVKQVAESEAVSAADLEKERQANLDEQISAGLKERETTFGPEGTEITIKDVPQNKTDQPDPNKAQQNFDKIAGAIHGLATIAKALDTGEYTAPRIPSSWESVKSKTAEVSTVDPDDPDKNRWRWKY